MRTPLLVLPPRRSLDKINTTALHSVLFQCNAIANRSDFALVLAAAHALFPHDHFACSVVDVSNYRALYSFNLSFSDECLQDLAICESGAYSRLVEEWCGVNEPMFVTNASASRHHRQLSKVLERYKLNTLAIHGMRNVTGSRVSTFLFGRSSANDSCSDQYALSLLIPALHVGLSNVVFHEGAASDAGSDGCKPPSTANLKSLTKREFEVTKWLAWGKTNEEIACILDISAFTVKNHIQKILIKLNACNRTQAATRAIALGIVEKSPQTL